MRNNGTRVTDRLQLYSLHQIRYVKQGPRPETRTIRALFLGETRKQASPALTERAYHQGEQESSLTDRYLDVMFLTYRAGNGLPDSVHSGRYDVFTIFYCDPSGLKDLSVGNVILLPDGYRVKQFADHPDAPYGELLRKLRRIGEDSGLIDTSLAKIGKKSTDRLTKTRIRELHRGFTLLVEKAQPVVGTPE